MANLSSETFQLLNAFLAALFACNIYTVILETDE